MKNSDAATAGIHSVSLSRLECLNETEVVHMQQLSSTMNALVGEAASIAPLQPRTAWRSYVRLIRFHYHLSFICVPLGALLVTELTSSLAISLLAVYLSFNVVLYGGIYTMNGITDLESDAKDRFKSRRPLPQGEIRVKSAVVFSLIMISGGLVSSLLLFGTDLFYLFVVFLALNVFYSFVARRIPYLELAVNAATHPLRYLLGALLANGQVPVPLLLAIFSLAFGVVVTRRSLENEIGGPGVPRTAESYSRKAFFFLKAVPLLAIVGLAIADASVEGAFYLAILGAYWLLVIGANSLKPIRALLTALWTR